MTFKLRVNNPKDYSVIVGEAKPGETAPRRNIGAKAAPWEFPGNNPDCNTIYNLLTWACNEFSTREAMGSRKVIGTHDEKKMVTKKIDGKLEKIPKTWTYFELSPYSYMTYKELHQLIKEYASGILSLGIEPKGKEIFHIYAQTSAEWFQTALACNANAIPIATAYDTLGEEGLTHSLVETESVGIFVDNAILHTLVKPLEKAKNIRIIVYREDIDDVENHKDLKALRAVNPDLQIYSYNQVLARGKENFAEPLQPKPEDLALIMYTSGSTGPPKGVVLTNANVMAGVAGPTANINRTYIEPGDRLLAFLPLAHILEFTFELATLYWGGVLGYGTVKTISDASVRNCLGDIREFKPSVMVGVPAVWESVRKGILAKVNALPSFSQKLFWAAFRTKLKLTNMGLPCPLVDNLIFKKIKEATGGNLKIVLNGGAAISLETQQFITTLICPMVIGYGLTESNANTCLMTPRSYKYGTQGEITHAVTIKLVDVPDAGYFAKNNQGELLIQGPPVSSHYFKNEKETSAAYTDDGWFRTGDIGEWTPEGHIKLVDRKKNLIKTLNGEYIAIEKLESVYRSDSYILNICVYADENRVKPVAIIVPNPAQVEKLTQALGIDSHEDIAQDPAVIEAIQQSVIETGQKGGLKGIEIILGVVVSKVEWTPQNGFLTSAQKLERKKILADNKEAIEKLYNKYS